MRWRVAKPSLYNYYRSKEDLLLDLVDQGMTLWTAACMAPFHRGGTFGRQLADHLRMSVDFARQRPNVVALFHLATTPVQGELSRRVETLVQQKESEIREVIHRRIVEALESGELSAASAAGVHVFLGIFFHGLLFLQTTCGHEVGPLHERLEEVWRFLYRGLSGREQPRHRGGSGVGFDADPAHCEQIWEILKSAIFVVLRAKLAHFSVAIMVSGKIVIPIVFHIPGLC